MTGSWPFSRKLTAAFLAQAILTGVIAVAAIVTLRAVIASKDEVLSRHDPNLVDAEGLHTRAAGKGSSARGYLLTRDPKELERMAADRAEFLRLLGTLRGRVSTDESRSALDRIEAAEADNERANQDVVAAFKGGLPADEAGRRFSDEVRPTRERLDGAVEDFVTLQRRRVKDATDEASDAAARGTALVVGLAALLAAVAIAASLLLGRLLGRQISSAVQHVRSSSAELQTAAGQQASGAREQATAMAEVTTTISELLATSRQIAESAQRVAHIANETAGAAREGNLSVERSQEAVAAIRRQVELIVGHMVDLGKKSQQIGGILEIINELAEQTNILAINATIEAAGAGEVGRRFAVVAEEIRKLADRVGGSTKDIRGLIDEIRASVNTTVMATEGGSKAVEAGARQFGELAAAFKHIGELVTTTTQAANEIELSTKQQTTAVEQVNVAIANAAQATREAETSSGQSLQTASQLAEMSTELSRLVRSDAHA